MLKVVVGYPEAEDELTVVERSLAGMAEVRQILELDELEGLRAAARSVYVDPALARYAVQIASATRDPASSGSPSSPSTSRSAPARAGRSR